MRHTRRFVATLLALALAVLAGCGAGGSSTGAGVEKVELKDGERVKVTFWHAMGGKLEEAVDALVAEFNASQTKVEVEAINQGSYDDALAKLKAAGTSGPTMIQVYEIGSRFMIDSGLIQPMQNFIDADNFNTADLEDTIAAYYTFDGKQYSMPFNTSTPILYYNKTAFKNAGLDPEKPPATFEEFAEYAKQLTGGDTQYGAAIALYGWFFEQLLAVQNVHYTDNENGRKDKATKAIIDSPEGERILTWIKGMVDEGSAINLGRRTAETQNAFKSGQIAMTLDSTAVLSGMLDGVGGAFEVGTGFLPRPTGSEGGVIIGGASLWITNIKPAKEQWAAWEFVKWLASPEVQAKWHSLTGYFPVNKKAYETDLVKQLHAQAPQFQTAIDQLRASKISTVTQGAVMGVFPQARQLVEGAMEAVMLGEKSAADALKEAAAAITEQIEEYNRTVQ